MAGAIGWLLSRADGFFGGDGTSETLAPVLTVVLWLDCCDFAVASVNIEPII